MTQVGERCLNVAGAASRQAETGCDRGGRIIQAHSRYITSMYTTQKPHAPAVSALFSSSRRRKDGKGGAPPAGLGAGGKRGDEGDGVPTAPSAAVAGAGAGPGGELEFNMAAIDLSDMKVCQISKL